MRRGTAVWFREDVTLPRTHLFTWEWDVDTFVADTLLPFHHARRTLVTPSNASPFFHPLRSCTICHSRRNGGTYRFSDIARLRRSKTGRRPSPRDSWTSQAVTHRARLGPPRLLPYLARQIDSQIAKRRTAEYSPPEELAGDARCIKSTRDGDDIKYYLWKSPRSCCLSATLRWPLASPKCAGRVGVHLTAISGSSSRKADDVRRFQSALISGKNPQPVGYVAS